MVDPAIRAIEAKGTASTFAWFRRKFMKDHNRKADLDAGHAIIGSVQLLDQYLYSYGRMIESQWECSAGHLSSIQPPDGLIDYGCGQGLAGLLINDHTDPSLLAEVERLLLIDPSAVALGRAHALYASIAPNAHVKAVDKKFDDLRDTDIADLHGRHTLHLFSNSLDVLGFDPDGLLERTLKPGRHTILSVSHDRDFNGGTPRVTGVMNRLCERNGRDLTVRRSLLAKFICTNQRKSKGVVWLCELEIHDR